MAFGIFSTLELCNFPLGAIRMCVLLTGHGFAEETLTEGNRVDAGLHLSSYFAQSVSDACLVFHEKHIQSTKISEEIL